MALKTVFSDLNIAYNSALDANAKISFIKIDDKHYLKIEGKENSNVKVNFSKICEAASSDWTGSEIRIPIKGTDDLVVKFENGLPDSTAVGIATATLNTSYDIGYGKGVYGPVLFGTDNWNAWPSSDKNVDAYFFKGDNGRIFLRVNARSKKPQKVLLKIKQVQNDQVTVGKIAIPTSSYFAVTANTQSYPNAVSKFDFPAEFQTDAAGNLSLTSEFERTLLFQNIYYSKAGDKNGLNYASGNVYGPIAFHHRTYNNIDQSDSTKYTLVEDYNKAIKDKLKADPVQWVIRKNGKELGVLQTSASESDAINSIDEDFLIRIDDIKIVGDIIDPSKSKSILWDNYQDITNDEGKLDTGNIKTFYNILDGGKELSITDGSNDAATGDKDFSIIINEIDDNLEAKLDVYHFGEETGNNNRPVIIGLHPGYWGSGTESQTKEYFLGGKAQFFRKRDYIFVNVEYRRSPEPPPNLKGQFNGYDKNRVKFPAHIEDIAAAIKWVRDNIANYAGDPNNIILYGHGSGAHLATLLVSNKKWLNDAGVDPTIIKGCISSSNIAWNIKNELDKNSDSIVPDTKVSIYNAFGIDPSVGGAEAKIDFESSDKAKEAYDTYSPDLHLSTTLPPLLILTRGSGSTIQRADEFVKKLDSVGIASTSILHYKYPDNKTYSQTTLQSVIGFTDPPSGFVLPKNVDSASKAITDFLTKINGVISFPTDAIIEYPEIDGQKYSAVSGISTVPLPVGFFGNPAQAAAAAAQQSNNAAQQIVLPSGGIFGDPGVEAIQIGYIDPVLGYVTGLSVCEANEQAQANPGTTFVAIDGDNSVNYLSINDVNKLTPDFTKSNAKCDGLKATVNCGEPILNIYGGGGVGAKANIIIGTDGSVLGVDLVHKGYGYQYPPLVQAIDKCYFGNGATFEAFLGSIADKEEVFDKEGDFEDYYVCPPGTSFGTLYDTSGKEVGKWDPSLYTNPSANPIAKQVEDYEKLVNQIKNPWWTTRQKKPSKVVGTNDKALLAYPVSHPCTVVDIKGKEINDEEKLDSVPPSIKFSASYDGVKDEVKTFKAGEYRISVNLNQDTGPTGVAILVKNKKTKEVIFDSLQFASKASIKLSAIKDFQDIKDFKKNSADIQQFLKKSGVFVKGVKNKSSTSFEWTKIYFPESDKYEVSISADDKADVSFDYVVVPGAKKSNNLPKAKFIKKNSKLYLDTTDFEGKVKLDFQFLIKDTKKGGKGLAATKFEIVGTNIKFDREVGEKTLTSGNTQKTFSIDGGKVYGPVIFTGGDIKSGEFLQSETEIFAADPKTFEEFKDVGGNKLSDTIDFTVSIIGASGKTDPGEPTDTWNNFMNTYAVSPVPASTLPGTDFATTPFTMEWDQVFPYDGDYIFRGCADGSTKELYLDNELIAVLKSYNEKFAEVKKKITAGPHTIRIDLENGGVTKTQALPNLVEFTVKGEANKNGSSLDDIFFTFTSDDGKDSFTFKAREKNQSVSGTPTESTISSDIKANFNKKGNDIFLVVTGKGSGKIKFTADVDDSFAIAGVAANEIEIPAEGSPVSLKRTQGKTKETIKASGKFKAGKTYGPIKIIGAAKNAGSPVVTNQKIGLLDADGKDQNIKITFDTETNGPTPSNSLVWERKETVKIRPNVVYNVKAHENTKKYNGVEQGIFKTKKGDSQEVGEGAVSNKIFADFLGSENDNDDIQIIAGEGEFKSFNKKKAKDGKRNTYDLIFIHKKDQADLGKTSIQNIFDTISYIDKADRQLWKVNPFKAKDGDFFSKYGVSPYTTEKTKLTLASDYAGIHPIIWEKVNFPSDGTYTIVVAVDDNVKIYIGNKKSGGKMADGSGLKSAADGGDEEIFDVKGFSSPGVSAGKYTFTRKFKAGDYRIRAELEQISGSALAKGNPMVLAMQITKKEGGTKDVISKKSWCENPLGAAVTIEAPPAPVPQEPAIVFDKCPPTPLWSTRQPKAEKIWYPVKYNGYKSFIEQISKVPKKKQAISQYKDVEFTVTGEGSVGDTNLKYLEFVFEAVQLLKGDIAKETFVLKGVELKKDKKTGKYVTSKKIRKNLKYKVTARIADKKKTGFTQVEQGLSILKGKNATEAGKNKKTGTSIFADFIGSSNDNDDIGVSIAKGDGEFSIGKKSNIGGRTTYELFYELESKENIGSTKTVEIKPKFIKDKKDGKIYLDMTDYPTQEYELDFKFIMADTVKGDGGLAASKFEISGTNIQFSRYKNGKVIEDKTIKKKFKLTGGKKYGPIIFSGGDKGSSTQLISADQIASYDLKSTNNFNEKTKKTTDQFDFNVILTDVAGVEYQEPQNIEGWSKFMNRYAISPVQPLYAPGTDGGGKTYDNSWDIEFPYDGFYKFEAQADNKAAVYVDGTEVLANIVNFKETVSSNKVFVSKGKHKVKVEVENEKTEVYEDIDEKIFSTKDKVDDNNTKTVSFTIKGNSQSKKGISVLDNIFFTFTSEDGKDTYTFPAITDGQSKGVGTWKKVDDEFNPPDTFHRYDQGTFYKGKKIRQGGDWNDTNPNTNYIQWDKETRLTLGKYYPDKGARFGIAVWKRDVGEFERTQEVVIRTNVAYKVVAHENTKKYNGVEQGIYKTKKGDSQEVGEGAVSNKIFADFLGSENDNDDIQIIADSGDFKSSNKKKTKDGKRNTYDLTYTLKDKSASKSGGTFGKSGKGTYTGPDLNYDFTHKGWSEFMNKYNVIPASKSPTGKTYTLTWKGVEFPSDGQYEYKIQADNEVVFRIDGKEVTKFSGFKGSPSTKYVEVSKGKRTIELILTNNPPAPSNGFPTFSDNPTGVSLYISKKVNKLATKGKSWLENPMGVAVAIIPPPCPKKVGGKGVIDKIIPTNPGTGYSPPTPPSSPTDVPIVPYIMGLTGATVVESGINYDCSNDPIVITPNNGAVLSYTCDNFGKIKEIKVEQPGEPFTVTPVIDIPSPTGVGVKIIPELTPQIAPPGVPVDKIIQVTDLAGLKQTGWIDGRPYFGAVFSKDGLLYTGYYQTVGELVRVYATQEESITGEVVTPPSAILRTGTDVTSNDPRLDIPGTPGGLVS